MRLFIDGVNTRELRFGLAAALGVLSARGVSPYEGAAAWFKIEGPGELTAEEHRAADAWLAAEEAAALMCCGACGAQAQVVLELATPPQGELWVGKRPSGSWAWEVLVDQRPDGPLERIAGEADSETGARAAGTVALEAVQATA